MRQPKRKVSKNRSSTKRRAQARARRVTRSAKQPSGSRSSSRVAKARVLERILHDTREVNGGSLLTTLRKQGYEELPLDEIQDRLSKLRTALGEFIVSRRG